MSRNRVQLPGKARGASEGCPFCRAARSSVPGVGARFRRLSGFEAGRIGTVVQSPAPHPLSENEFLAHMDGEPCNYHQRILPQDVIELIPAPEPPSWAPPVELRIAAELDRAVVAFCEAGSVAGGWVLDWPALFEIIRLVWSKRLPLSAEEMWGLLMAHGVPGEWEEEIVGFFQRGRDLLVYAIGKRPVKKYRVQPLSVSTRAQLRRF